MGSDWTLPAIANVAKLAAAGSRESRIILRGIGEERDFRPAVEAYARDRGWLVHHERMSGHRTADNRWVSHGEAGRPDLLLARNCVVLVIELKEERGKLTEAQERWLLELGPAGGVWRPGMAQSIMEVLD